MVEPARGILLPVSASHPDPDTFCGWICAGSSFPHTATKGVGGDYLPWEVPLLKPVAAVAGSDVCAQGARLFIDGQAVAKRLGRDAMGRRMPWWSGCRRLGAGEPFLLNARHPASLESSSDRFFVGRTVQLWLP